MSSYTRLNLLRASLLLALIVGVAAVFAQPLALAQTGQPVSGNGIVPIYKEGNPTCKDLGYVYSLKFDYPDPQKLPGTYPLGTGTVTWSTDGTYVSWSSTFGVDAVIVKGGPNANVYQYSPESFGDTGLASPINPRTNKPYGLSYVDFCYDYELSVTKDAQTSLTRTYTWTIDKSVAPAEWNLFTGDSGTSQYTVAVEKTVTDSDWAVKGTITIYNPDPSNPAKITGVSDVVSPAINATVNCGVTFPYTLASGGTLQCTYSASLPNGDNRTNTASVTTSGLVGGGSGTATVDFDKATIKEVGYSSVNVDDTNGGSWEFSASGFVTYDKTFTCDDDAGKHDNTATIRETAQFDSASVTVNCYALKVTKDAATSFTRTYNWTIDKSADQSALTLALGQQFLVNYSVVVNATYTDSDWAVSGKIWVKNPAPMAATINSVSDVVSPDIPATVNCGVTFPYSLAADGTLECTYNASLPDASSRTNTATATLQNYDYDKDGNGTASGTTDFSGTAEVSFAKATMTKVDECVDVSDSYAGDLGTVCYPDVPKTFTYSRWIGPYDACGDYTVENTASFVANDTGATGSDGWTVTVHVPCLKGCTLTPGYWKTHSKYGPAPYDDTWALIGEDTPFFLSGQSWYRVLWTPPAGGNAYYILAHAYIAAKLNILNGAASTPQVDAALAWATSFFNTYKPTDKLSKTVRADAIYYAGLLDSYNNGYIGPGHCSE